MALLSIRQAGNLRDDNEPIISLDLVRIVVTVGELIWADALAGDVL